MSLEEAYRKVQEYVSSGRGAVSERPLLIEALNKLDEPSTEPVLIIAPTGYGKSSISMSVALREFYRNSKVIVAYPLRALIEQQAMLMKGLFKHNRISEDVVGTRYMGSRESPYLVRPVTLTTVDTLSLTALGLPPEDISKVFKGRKFQLLGHYLFSWSSVFTSSFIILDEVHLMYDSTKSLSFLSALMDICKRTNTRVVLMTATFPKVFENALRGKVKEKVEFSRDKDQSFYDERCNKKYEIELRGLKRDKKLYEIREKFSKMKDEIKRLSAERVKALIIFNTVEDAVEFYRNIGGRKVLLHSRFTEEDKRGKMRELMDLKFSDEDYVVVSTQAIEAGVDISSNLIITEIAPPISLVQRFGRFLRYDEKEGKAFVWYEEEALEDHGTYKVYDKELVKRTVDYLDRNHDLNLHISYDDFVNKVYLEEPHVDRELTRQLSMVWVNLLKPTEPAMELFIKLEGSLVREGPSFTAVSKNDYEVNVSFDYLERLRRKGLCRNCPTNVQEALIRSLDGEKFKVDVEYDSEVGLV